METDKPILPISESNELTEQLFTKKNTFYDHENMIDEIISNKPPAIVRFGTVWFLFILIFLSMICWFIQYPDIIYTNAKLTLINGPKEVVTKASGKLIKLFAKEGEQTIEGSILGYIESTGSHTEIIYLSDNIDTIANIIRRYEVEKILPYLNTQYQNLGELQQPYQTFLHSFLTFRKDIAGGFYLSQKTMLLKEISFLKKSYNYLLEQKKYNIKDVELSLKSFEAKESLKTENVISDLYYHIEASKLINKNLTLSQINLSLINNEARQNEKQKEILELENTIEQKKNIFFQSINTLKSQIDSWKKKYILTAPISGKISFVTFLQESQQLQENKTIFVINPENTQYFAEIFIPKKNFSKVRFGQDVLLKFPSYPFQEYGIVIGKIDFISTITTDSGYLAKVILPNALTTSFKRQVQFREGLQAHGEIITQNIRLLQRIYYSIIKHAKS